MSNLDTYLAETGPELIESLNRDFEDAVLLVGRTLGSCPDATQVVVTSLDPRGLDATAVTPDGGREVRIGFAEPISAPEELTAAFIALVTDARELSGESGSTSAEREAAASADYRTFITTVVAVEQIHPHLRRVTFGGGDLVEFAPVGPDTFLYLLLPPPGRDELTIDASFTWEQHARMPPEDQPVGGYYTVRTWRPEVAELDVLMVLHGDAGPASAWATRADVGRPVGLWGPRTAYHPPPDTDQLVLVADETGLPAVAAILEHVPDDLPATVIAEVDSVAERHELPVRANDAVVWLHRDGAAAGTTSLLADAVSALPPFDGTPYVWGGAESHAMTAVRRHVRDERGLPRDAVSLVAYWRHTATTDEQVD